MKGVSNNAINVLNNNKSGINNSGDQSNINIFGFQIIKKKKQL